MQHCFCSSSHIVSSVLSLSVNDLLEPSRAGGVEKGGCTVHKKHPQSAVTVFDSVWQQCRQQHRIDNKPMHLIPLYHQMLSGCTLQTAQVIPVMLSGSCIALRDLPGSQPEPNRLDNPASCFPTNGKVGMTMSFSCTTPNSIVFSF